MKGLDHVVKVENDRLPNQNFHTLGVSKEVSLNPGATLELKVEFRPVVSFFFFFLILFFYFFCQFLIVLFLELGDHGETPRKTKVSRLNLISRHYLALHLSKAKTVFQ